MWRRRFHDQVLQRPGRCFAVMCLSFALFGTGTVNLFMLLRANALLIVENGRMALADGAGLQFVELVVSLALSMLAYVVFKACEHALVHALGHPPSPSTDHPEP